MNWIFAASLTLGLSADLLPPRPDEVLRLPEATVNALEEKVMARSPLSDRRLDYLVDYMFSQDGLNFKYVVEPSRMAAATHDAGEGNCLSFTLLFLAMADEIGLEAWPREVRVPLNWRRNGAALFESGHVNVLVRTEVRRAVVDFEPDPELSRRLSITPRAKRISRDRVLAHFYNNRAGELLADGKAGLARLWSEQAIALEPNFTAALNNRGLIEARLGNDGQALQHYRHALAVDPDNRSTLFNMLELHRRTGRRDAADEVLDRIESLHSGDPYLHWTLARNLERLGELARSERLYRRAIELKDDEPMFHAALARVALERGDDSRAREALSAAVALSETRPGDSMRWRETLHGLKSGLGIQ